MEPGAGAPECRAAAEGGSARWLRRALEGCCGASSVASAAVVTVLLRVQ